MPQLTPPHAISYNLLPCLPGDSVTILECDVAALMAEGWEPADSPAPATPDEPITDDEDSDR